MEMQSVQTLSFLKGLKAHKSATWTSTNTYNIVWLRQEFEHSNKDEDKNTSNKATNEEHDNKAT